MKHYRLKQTTLKYKDTNYTNLSFIIILNFYQNTMLLQLNINDQVTEVTITKQKKIKN